MDDARWVKGAVLRPLIDELTSAAKAAISWRHLRHG
jgi:hypothetical protein